MPNRSSPTGSELFIVDNSDADWKVMRYLHDWCQISKAIDIATGYFEIGSLLGLKDEWQKVDHIRILMGDEVSSRTMDSFTRAVQGVTSALEKSIQAEKLKSDFLTGVDAIVGAIRAGKIQCRVYRRDKFHAKAYITHARLEVVGSSALVGSSNFTYPGLTENIELNVQITGRPVSVLQEWYEEHWQQAEDVTPDILRAIERHIQEYAPFLIYAKSLQEYFRGHEMTPGEWEVGRGRGSSRIYPVLDQYQKDGYQALLKISGTYRGALLCDGVGLGKTFIGLMLLERLVEFDRKRVVLIVPKAARKPVWEAAMDRYLPHLSDIFSSSNFVIINHTDLQRGGEFSKKMDRIKDMAEAIIIDEAHHFRNPGILGIGEKRPSRYRRLYDICEGKQMFLLTATPVNNKLIDLQHMMELFTRRQPDYFKDAPLGIHSLPGHFRTMEKELEKLVERKNGSADGIETNQVEASQVLTNDALFQRLVVQRSRAYVRKSQEQNGGNVAMFPMREPPRVADYSVKKTYGKLLAKLESAFSKQKPLFSLAIYYPLAFYTGPDKSITPFEEGRQSQVVTLIRTQFLKRFESSAHAFEASCYALLEKLLAWVTKHSQTSTEKRNCDRWSIRHANLIRCNRNRQNDMSWKDESEENDEDDDQLSEELLESVEELSRDEYDIEGMLAECYNDLDQLVDFLAELQDFEPRHDDKLAALLKLLKTDPVLNKEKVLIFSEFAATARYLRKQLKEAGITGVDQVDGGSKRDRGEIIRNFAPYYNGSSSKEVGAFETRVLIATDVLSEGLNLQDATRLINYDLHWNPVRLMQRIGRVDRRMNPEIEQRLLADHAGAKFHRGKIVYWNFLPPDDLDDLLRLYSRVSHKTLRISKTFGIEGKKLLRPDDDFDALKDFTHAYEGDTTPIEEMHLEYQKLLKDNPDLADRLDHLPGRVFSGKENVPPGARAVFFCYALPAPPTHLQDLGSGDRLLWTESAGETKWYLYEVLTGRIVDDPSEIIAHIRSTPETQRKRAIADTTLSDVRREVEKHIRNTYLKSAQAPAGVKPVLKAWMELN